MEALWDFVEKTCKEQGIDDSHGIKHSKGCVEWVEKLLDKEVDVTEDERQLAIYSAALHDMCDRKYIDVATGLTNIQDWLILQGWSASMVVSLLTIINTTSYSKLKRVAVNGVHVFPDHGIYNRVYHIVRHADLLEAYVVGRCFIYQKHVAPEISDEECWKLVRDLFDNRVFKYVSDGWITLPSALSYVKDLEAVALDCFDKKIYKY